MKLGNRNDPDPDACRKIPILAAIGRPAYPDDDIASGVQQPLLHRPAERRAMVIARGAKVDVVQVGMTVELDHAQAATLRQRPQDRQGAQMIAATGQRQDPRRPHPGIERLHPRHAVHQVGRIGCHIAQVGTARQIKRRHPGRTVLRPDHGGQIAQLARPMARARPVGGAAIPRRADQPDLHLAETRMVKGHMRQPHEGRNAGESRQIKSRNRLKEPVACRLAHAIPHCLRALNHPARPRAGPSATSARREIASPATQPPRSP